MPLRDVAVGVDIGGTKTFVVAIGSDREVFGQSSSETPALAGASAVLENAREQIRRIVAPDVYRRIGALGVAATGAISETGIVTASGEHMPGWRGVELASEFAIHPDMVVVAENDVRAWAAAILPAEAQGNSLFVAVGTGVGGALAVDGRLIHGSHGTTGEIGHMVVDCSANPRRCNCGGFGHLEMYVSGPAMVALYRDDGGSPNIATLPQLSSAATDGDRSAQRVIQTGARVLGRAIAGLVVALDLDRVAVAGGVLGIGPMFQGPLRRAIEGSTFPETRTLELTLDHGHAKAAAVHMATRARNELRRRAVGGLR